VSVLRYGVVGDSYSNGEGVGLEHSWPAQLARRIGAEVVVNNSVTGWTSQQAIDHQLEDFRRAQPEVATLQIGVNDWVQGVSAETFRANLRTLLDEMLSVVGAPERLIAVTIPDFSVTPDGANYTHGRDATAGLASFNAIIEEECAARDVSVVDVFELARDTADDGLHPSAQQLAQWTDGIEPVARQAWSSAAE
jgi:lysophospholipase L1-like esterase